MSNQKEQMNMKEFKKYCEEHDDNLVTKWDYDKFEIRCVKCNSTNVKIVDNVEYNEGASCPTCGYDSYTSGRIIIKCFNCGGGMQVLNMEDLT